MNPFLGEFFVVVPRCDDELTNLSDDAVAEMFETWMRRRSDEGLTRDRTDLELDVERHSIVMSCCRELERRGREDLLRKVLK